MILRLWRGRTKPGALEAYAKHFRTSVFPALADLDGHRGAWLLRRETPEGTEVLVATLWDSLASIRAFAGSDVKTAVVEPAARAVLDDFDPFVRHYEVVPDNGAGRGGAASGCPSSSLPAPPPSGTG